MWVVVESSGGVCGSFVRWRAVAFVICVCASHPINTLQRRYCPVK
jgi:hypothetical protein